MNVSNDKESKKASEEPEKQNERRNGLICWLCKEKHRLMDCHEFKMKPEKDRIDFAAKEKICKNRFSKIHFLQDCIYSMKCRVDGCGKKHHTLLHLKSPHQATVNFTNKQDFTKPDQFHKFLQVIPATVIYGAITTVIKALPNFGSDTTLITSELAKTLKLKGKQRKLNITSAISTSVSVTSNLVEFSICSAHHPDQIEVRNTWVVPSQRISKAEIQRKWSYLKDVPTDVIDKDISILIGADLPYLHICHDVISGNQNEPIAVLTKLGWVLFGGNNNKTEISLNHFTSDHNLKNLVERFRDIECLGLLIKGILKSYQKATNVLSTYSRKLQRKKIIDTLLASHGKKTQ